jgi:hypothetical protein
LPAKSGFAKAKAFEDKQESIDLATSERVLHRCPPNPLFALHNDGKMRVPPLHFKRAFINFGSAARMPRVPAETLQTPVFRRENTDLGGWTEGDRDGSTTRARCGGKIAA